MVQRPYLYSFPEAAVYSRAPRTIFANPPQTSTFCGRKPQLCPTEGTARSKDPLRQHNKEVYHCRFELESRAGPLRKAFATILGRNIAAVIAY